MKPIKSIVMVVIILVFAACKNDDDIFVTPQNQDPDPTAFAQNFGSEITRTFLGTVVDTNNNPIENASISIGNATAMTDGNGVFIITDATVNQRFGYVKAEKAGYIHASRSVVPSEGTNKVHIMMLPETVAGSTSSGTQETIALGNGASVALEGDYIKPDGTAYSGTVNVIMHHLDSADNDMQDQMPGMLYAANAQNEERMLQTFGMLAVELRGDNGEDLNLAEGSTAEITVPLDASLIGNAPATIPLWYFDETHGYWIEDGVATLTGNNYVGTVSHFSFWNCSHPSEYNNICINVFDQDGNPLSNLRVSITRENSEIGNGTISQYSNACGIIPSNEILELKIYVFGCTDSLVYSNSIGPFSEDTILDIMIPPSENVSTEKVIGNFINCSGNPVVNGYAKLNFQNNYFGLINEGSFDINVLHCLQATNFTLEAIDADNFETTGSIEYTFANPITNVGTLQSCNAVEEFIHYTIDETVSVFTTDITEVSLDLENATSTIDVPFLTIEGIVDIGCLVSFYGYLYENDYVNTYEYHNNVFNDYGFTIGAYANFDCPDLIWGSNLNNNIIFNLTKLNNVGDYVDINFGGSYQDQGGTPHTINGVIHVLRDE